MIKTWLSACPRLNQLNERIGPLERQSVLARYIRWGIDEPLIRKDAESLERICSRLDPRAWEQLVAKVLPFSCRKHDTDGWQQFWNHLNEARGYVLLKECGYSRVTFLEPETDKKGHNPEFADLDGRSPISRALLDVKTINCSDDEAERVRKRNDPSFSESKNDKGRERPGDIRNVCAFASKLIQQSDPVSALLWNQMDKPSQDLLLNVPSDTKLMESELVQNLNRVLKGPCIYDKVRFTGIHLQPRTRFLLEQCSQSGNAICLNRCLLDDTYPQELAKWASVLSVADLSPRLIVPAKLQEKRRSVEKARSQIEATQSRQSQQNEPPVDRKIVLLIINRDFGCSSLSLNTLEATLQQPGLEVVCQIGDS
jgi:hypothetical protein